MAKALNTTELRGLSREALEKQVVELKEELFTLRFQAATGQLESHGRLRAVRKDIARIYTVIQERNLGIVSDPDAAEPETPGTMASASEKA
ncbi:50S ribosomal protein L29 [Desertihabitans aurantiacus]|uniref:50S ribosomal protein L29 n=1 Tax=Desertihabitans aurantiacus TaxID=2282477 RepID=UPI000DF7978B|nr:50S ribosomal protein L29 [Desertihabitans aurantiacus]